MSGSVAIMLHFRTINNHNANARNVRCWKDADLLNVARAALRYKQAYSSVLMIDEAITYIDVKMNVKQVISP